MSTSAPVALVTGGGRRIGRTICLALAEAGFDVAVHHRAAPDPAAAARDQSDGRGGAHQSGRLNSTQFRATTATMKMKIGRMAAMSGPLGSPAI
jgi:NAD(P)-dependent dehydrogenase (short-subunit alcohol dehydrogenase family)